MGLGPMRTAFGERHGKEEHGNTEMEGGDVGWGASKPEAKREIHRERRRKGIRAKIPGCCRVAESVCCRHSSAVQHYKISSRPRSPPLFPSSCNTFPPLSLACSLALSPFASALCALHSGVCVPGQRIIFPPFRAPTIHLLGVSSQRAPSGLVSSELSFAAF